MGCAGSRPIGGTANFHDIKILSCNFPVNLLIVIDEETKKIRKPKPWKHSEAITRAQLMKMREEFWDTAPHYGEIWDALRAAVEADLSLAQAIVDSAGVIVQNPDLTICYDERGFALNTADEYIFDVIGNDSSTRAVRDRILKDVNGDISDHLRNHIHLTNCIHLKNHMHKHSPISADRSLMRDLVVLQRSRSLRDPTASPHSWHSPSVVDLLLKLGEKDDWLLGDDRLA
ncbi:hypothetical protein BUALT_Bualt18G0119200 [Buddleja alternifolia]|uniref:DC-UbP/UBTD2 N-terminal domain-containing protein n=1 Tax=Buddleja alternifolia TaxID=168488 RepID=A0AAV6WA31_9LAMI|nr:hypothetical protein BUALT_Bualt18G0119200 [Buddleja alternifolia]